MIQPLNQSLNQQSTDTGGIKAAAVRKLQHELGIAPSVVPLDSYQFLGRIHYSAPCDEAELAVALQIGDGEKEKGEGGANIRTRRRRESEALQIGDGDGEKGKGKGKGKGGGEGKGRSRGVKVRLTMCCLLVQTEIPSSIVSGKGSTRKRSGTTSL